MTLSKRVLRILRGILMLLAAAILLAEPEYGYIIVIIILDIMLLVYGIRLLVYYITMARYMVGGIATFYKSIVVIDMGLFIAGLPSAPKKLAMVYLIVCLAFSGITDILHAVEAKNIMGAWKYEIVGGVVKTLVAVCCFGFLESSGILVVVYCVGLIHTALTYIVSAFRRTAVAYVAS